MANPNEIQVPGGMCVVTTYGSLQFEMVQCYAALREASVKAGLNIAWNFVCGGLVDAARNNAVAQFLAHQPALGWMLFIDGDMVFNPDALHHLLAFAYGDGKGFDIVGAHCTLRGAPYLPTIDTGTGSWESILPGQGPVEVMRTGTAFVLTKRHVYERIPGPWYIAKNPMRPLDAFAAVDNFAHTKFDGRNPLADSPVWQTLMKCAIQDDSSRVPHNPAALLGEDSGFCDAAKLAGFRIAVHTDVIVEHVDRKVYGAADHREFMKKQERAVQALVGA